MRILKSTKIDLGRWMHQQDDITIQWIVSDEAGHLNGNGNLEDMKEMWRVFAGPKEETLLFLCIFWLLVLYWSTYIKENRISEAGVKNIKLLFNGLGGMKWGPAGGSFLATLGTANETRSPTSVNKAWSAVCVKNKCAHAQRFAFVLHLKPISEQKCRKLSWHLFHHWYRGKGRGFIHRTPINTNGKWAEKPRVREEQTLPFVWG